MENKKNSSKKILIFIILIAIAIFSVKYFHIENYFTKEKIEQIISKSGIWAPVIFILIYSITPILFLPGIPFAIIAGAFFGPFWGVVYADIGATIGASLSFLIARYFLKEWVENKVKGTKFEKLYNDVEKNGWKVVAFTRLIPIFPYNMLNYFFGITKVRFIHYFFATLIFMIPGAVGYVVFGSSIFDLLKGKISGKFIIGISLIILISILPLIYKKMRGEND